MRRYALLIVFASLAGLVPVRASAQAHGIINDDWPTVGTTCALVFNPPPAPPQPDAFWKRSVACATGLFTARPIHPTIKTIVPGGGFGLAPVLTVQPNNGKWQNTLGASGTRSFTGFWVAQASFRATHDAFGNDTSARDRFVVEFYDSERGLPHLPFYGIGPDTSAASPTAYRQQDNTSGVHVFNPFSANFAAGVRLERIGTTVGDPKSGSLAPISSQFNDTSAPGFIVSPNMVRLQVYAHPRPARHVERADYTFEYNVFHDTTTGQFSFQRFEVNGSHSFAIPSGGLSVLTLTDRLEMSNRADVPFFLQETLGGSDINGIPSLRGFGDYRFRGPDLMAFEASYDQHIRWLFGGVVFYDLGQVADQWSGFARANLRHSYGAGLTIWASGRVWFRVSVGFSPTEGHHLYFGIPVF